MTTVTPGTKLGIRKITARIGAEITGLSPDLILDPETIAAVRAALNEHKALVFRGVRLDDEDQQPPRAVHRRVTRPRLDHRPGQRPAPATRSADATRDGKEVIFMSWQDFLARHQVGDVIEGVVTKQVPFGSFVESEGFTGLAHRQSWPAGARVSVRILAIDPDNQRFSLAPVY